MAKAVARTRAADRRGPAPHGHEHRREGQAGGHYEQRQVHRLNEGGLGQGGQPCALRAHLLRGGKSTGERVEGLCANPFGKSGESRSEHVVVASTDPATAMPTAAPTSRVVSLTAEATPCFSSGTAFMIAEVVGATHKPMPA